ncbi:MAG: hypothetical protein LBQ12_02875, partial [Deltaproteobacteria bacterium]|nr:hypothetical protein [Deltaproteobacteria bacterium]
MKALTALFFASALAASWLVPPPPEAAADGAPKVLWSKLYDQDNAVFEVEVLAAAGDGGMLVAGFSHPRGNRDLSDIRIMKLDRNGKIEFDRTVDESPYDYVKFADVTSDGGYLVGGFTSKPRGGNLKSILAGRRDALAIKLDRSGGVSWVKTYGGPGEDMASGVFERPGGGYLLVGTSGSVETGLGCGTARGRTSVWAAKLDRNGDFADGACAERGRQADWASAAGTPGGAIALVNSSAGGGRDAPYSVRIGADLSFGP